MPRGDRVDEDVARLRERQAGVLSRRQVVELGGTAADFRRLARAGVTVVPGVCLAHTGTPTWLERAWAAVLTVWPAALAGRSALRAEAGPGWRDIDVAAPIEVAVDRRRTVSTPPGITRVYVHDLATKVRWNAAPPRLRFEEAALDVALSAPDLLSALEALAAGVRARCTTSQRLLDALEGRARVTGRHQLAGLLTDLRDGTCSALEHAYLTRVERPHDLPAPDRQFRERAAGRTVYRDAEYERWGVTLELDGRTFHARDRQHAHDLERDLDLVVDGRTSVRLGWRQVVDTPCGTAAKVGLVLVAAGWGGRPRPCGPGCAVHAH